MLDQSFILIDGKAVDLGSILSQFDHGNLADGDFRKFLDDLESTPFGEYSSPICAHLFPFVKNNVGVQDHEELVALGCAIRKLIFNFNEQELSQVAEVLIAARDFRPEGYATNVEKMLCKVLVDRFESYPISYHASLEPVISCYREIVDSFSNEISLRDDTTGSTLLDATLGLTCYSRSNDQRFNELKWEEFPKWFKKLFFSLGQNIQREANSKGVRVPNLDTCLNRIS